MSVNGRGIDAESDGIGNGDEVGRGTDEIVGMEDGWDLSCLGLLEIGRSEELESCFSGPF